MKITLTVDEPSGMTLTEKFFPSASVLPAGSVTTFAVAMAVRRVVVSAAVSLARAMTVGVSGAGVGVITSGVAIWC